MNIFMWFMAGVHLFLDDSKIKIMVNFIIIMMAIFNILGWLPEEISSTFLKGVFRIVFLSGLVKPIVLIDFITMKKLLKDKRRG